MGEAQGTLFEPEFNRSIKVQTFSQKLTSHAGALLLRERLYALAMGSETQDDLDRLAHDPAMRMAVWNRPGEEVLEQRLASQPTQSRLIDWLATSCGTGNL